MEIPHRITLQMLQGVTLLVKVVVDGHADICVVSGGKVGDTASRDAETT